ncbi:MAG: uncharacterized membrane protein YgdD (TMEM256/DUF423 family) [Verrucomicrobiales bacterium]|jgi:uncharacterized membrane protein YgdD (TMEM256/DUF423 family)
MTATRAFRISAIMAFLAVTLGAFGAHSLKEILTQHDRMGTWETASFYHLTHALVLCALASRQPFRRGAWWCFFLGILIFSGSLYTLSLTNITVLGAITPLGGLAMLIGWAWLAIKGIES